MSLEDTLGGQIIRHVHWLILAPLWSPEVIGVAELVNKINGPWFSKFDEDLATAFSIYCGISIAHVSGTGAGPCRTLCSPLHNGPPCCPDGFAPAPGAQSSAAGLLCSLQYLLVTSGLSFPSENWGYYFQSCPVSLLGLCFISPFSESNLNLSPCLAACGDCWVSLSITGSSDPGI